MPTPLVSVLIPVWNAEATLGRALRTLLAQTLTEWQCVLVDDGSSDRSLSIARQFAASDPRFHVVAVERGGIVAALNQGRSHCEADLIARFDADDLMHPERLARQVAHLGQHPRLQAVGCHVRLFPRRTLTAGRLAYQSWLNGLTDEHDIYRDRFVECPVAHPTLMLRAAELAALGYRDVGWPEDYDLVLRLLANGPALGTVPVPLLAWRDAPSRLSRTHPMYGLDRFVSCKAHFLSEGWLGGRTDYVLWGYGDTGRNLCRALRALGKSPTHILELHPGRIGQTIAGAPVIRPEQALSLGGERAPIVASVAGAAARGQLRRHAEGLGLREGRDFVVAA
jgi:glycosyltransferase involved in cell wall biosynthesis